jgi:hypothetical protein
MVQQAIQIPYLGYKLTLILPPPCFVYRNCAELSGSRLCPSQRYLTQCPKKWEKTSEEFLYFWKDLWNTLLKTEVGGAKISNQMPITVSRNGTSFWSQSDRYRIVSERISPSTHAPNLLEFRTSPVLKHDQNSYTSVDCALSYLQNWLRLGPRKLSLLNSSQLCKFVLTNPGRYYINQVQKLNGSKATSMLKATHILFTLDFWNFKISVLNDLPS